MTLHVFSQLAALAGRAVQFVNTFFSSQKKKSSFWQIVSGNRKIMHCFHSRVTTVQRPSQKDQFGRIP